jgi:hypothetical protein
MTKGATKEGCQGCPTKTIGTLRRKGGAEHDSSSSSIYLVEGCQLAPIEYVRAPEGCHLFEMAVRTTYRGADRVIRSARAALTAGAARLTG